MCVCVCHGGDIVAVVELMNFFLSLLFPRCAGGRVGILDCFSVYWDGDDGEGEGDLAPRAMSFLLTNDGSLVAHAARPQ